MADEHRYALESFFGSDQTIELVQYVPHCLYLDMKVVEVGPKRAVLSIPYRDDLVGDPVSGVVFGGVITTLLDQTCGLATLCSLEDIEAIATLDLRIDYLRAAEPGRELTAVGECYKLTRSVAFLRGFAYDREPDDPFASCVGAFMVGAHSNVHPLARRGAQDEGA